MFDKRLKFECFHNKWASLDLRVMRIQHGKCTLNRDFLEMIRYIRSTEGSLLIGVILIANEKLSAYRGKSNAEQLKSFELFLQINKKLRLVITAIKSR